MSINNRNSKINSLETIQEVLSFTSEDITDKGKLLLFLLFFNASSGLAYRENG
jgi:hypothetical protein